MVKDLALFQRREVLGCEVYNPAKSSFWASIYSPLKIAYITSCIIRLNG